MDENTQKPRATPVEPQPTSLSAAATPKKPKAARTARPRRSAKPRGSSGPKVVKVSPGSGQATVAETIGKNHYDAPKLSPRRATMDPHSMDVADKVVNLAQQFHVEQDVATEPEQSQADKERDAAMSGAGRRGASGEKAVIVPEEDRRRAILSKQTGVDLFKRGPEGRPDEPTLQEVNENFFKTADGERQRSSDLQTELADTLVAAFGRKGKRLQKSLR